MMYGLKESDSGIVASKPANNGLLSPAESVEQRPGPKGNPEHRRTGPRAEAGNRVT